MVQIKEKYKVDHSVKIEPNEDLGNLVGDGYGSRIAVAGRVGGALVVHEVQSSHESKLRPYVQPRWHSICRSEHCHTYHHCYQSSNKRNYISNNFFFWKKEL